MIYKETILSKNNLPVPVFYNGKPMHSKYNPQNEILITPQESKEGFFLIMGIGAGYHIKNLLQNLSSYFIVAVEPDKESLDYCKNFPVVKELLSNKNIVFCSKDDLSNVLIEHYIPSLYGNLFILPQRAWQNENAEEVNSMQKIIKETLENISNDYSVQAHFGKIWMSNIMANLRTFKKNPVLIADTDLVAAVIAAGPSLDTSIQKLHNNRASYFIISTDTAYGTLLKNEITPNIVVSVDAQQVSTTHFMECPIEKDKATETIFVFDICTNPSVPTAVKKKGYKVFFIQSGHPLSQIASQTANLPHLATGAGTVTIACCDAARYLGFKKIELFGADFAYSKGKPYAKGTYLETQFISNADRLTPQETKFTALMYRTPLKDKDSNNRIFTSDVLQRYENTLAEWANCHSYKKNNNLLETTTVQPMNSFTNKDEFNFKLFIKDWIKGLNDKTYQNTLLPYIAFLQAHKNKDNISILELYNLAYHNAIRYNS